MSGAFSNWSSLKGVIQKEMKQALSETRENVSIQLDENILGYYEGGEPILYQRTGTLIDASNVTPVLGGGDSCEFKAEMNGNRIDYSTGTFSGSQVVEATETGTYGIVGASGYWRKTETEIPNIMDVAFSKRFK